MIDVFLMESLFLCCFLNEHTFLSRVLLFVDEADAFLRKRSQVHLHLSFGKSFRKHHF